MKRKVMIPVVLLFTALLSLADSPPDGTRYASLTIYVKSADNQQPLAGAEVKIAAWRRFRNSPHNEWKPAWDRERFLNTDDQGRILIDTGTMLTRSAYGDYAAIGDNVEFMYAMTATCTGFTQAQQKAYLKFETPNPVSTFYLPVYRGR